MNRVVSIRTSAAKMCGNASGSMLTSVPGSPPSTGNGA